MPERTYTTKQAAKALGLSRDGLLKRIRLGQMKDVAKDGRGHRVWFQSDIDKAQKSQRLKGGEINETLDAETSIALQGRLP